MSLTTSSEAGAGASSSIAADPQNVFDQAALNAIARWRYNPRIVNGEAVERVGVQTEIRFELTE